MTDNILLKGCGTAIFTPFKGGGTAPEVDYETFVENVRRQVEAGIDFLVPLGTTGETPTLSDAEKIRVLTLAKENAEGRPVVAGVGTNSIPGTLANIRLLTVADAYLVVVPYYNKPPQRGLYEYFKAIAGETDKPIILYNVPGRTGTNMDAETTLRLAEDVPNIIAVKEASGKIDQVKTILKHRPKGFIVLSGNDDDTLELMKGGAEGVISVASNVCPDLMEAFTTAALRKEWGKAERYEEHLKPLFHALFVEPNPIPGKAAMARMGLMENSLRLPLVEATEQTDNLINKVLEDLWKK